MFLYFRVGPLLLKKKVSLIITGSLLLTLQKHSSESPAIGRVSRLALLPFVRFYCLLYPLWSFISSEQDSFPLSPVPLCFFSPVLRSSILQRSEPTVTSVAFYAALRIARESPLIWHFFGNPIAPIGSSWLHALPNHEAGWSKHLRWWKPPRWCPVSALPTLPLAKNRHQHWPLHLLHHHHRYIPSFSLTGSQCSLPLKCYFILFICGRCCTWSLALTHLFFTTILCG